MVLSSESVVGAAGSMAVATAGRRILDADYAVVLVQVHGHVGSVGLRDVGFVFGVAVGVGLGPHESGAATSFGQCGGLDLGEHVAGQRGLVATLTAVAASAAGASIFHADHVEGFIQVDGGPRAVGFDHVHFVLGIAIRVGLSSDHGGVASHLRQRGGCRLAESVAGQQGLVAALLAPGRALVGDVESWAVAV